MDLSSSFLNQSTYDFYINKIYESIKEVAEVFFSAAAKKEKKLTCDKTDIEDTVDITVSGDGSWQKRGFSSLHGVATLIGYYSGKVLDTIVKSSYCKSCESWKHKLNSAEFEEWFEEHKEKGECQS